MVYRKEIDGLRAVAIIPVIFFHASFEWFKGGYVGVDVFFVISGYLITTIILKEKDAGDFQIINFYERRVRRILPALFTMMMICLPFAWYWMMPSQLLLFSRSLIAVPLFLSNILFWRENDYFALDAIEKPLLHTWSLAVEEQYYVIFPLFLVLFWAFGKRFIFILLGLFALFSFLFAQFGGNLTFYAPYLEKELFWFHQTDYASFYLTTGRAWELLIGSLVAYYLYNKKQTQRYYSQLFSMFGFLLIIYAIIFFDETTPYPSAYTLLPTIGTALIIIYARVDTLIGRLLSSKLLVGIGLISYSAYLWHQPLFAFARLRITDEPDKILFSFLILATYVTAYFSWKYIETPFRNKEKVSKIVLVKLSFLFSALFIIIGFIGHFNDGFREATLKKISDDKKMFLVDFEPLMEQRKKTWNKILKNSDSQFIDDNRHKITIVGDSQSDDLFVSLELNKAKFEKNYQFRHFNFENVCMPQYIGHKYINKICSDPIKNIISDSIAGDSDYIFFVMRWLPEDMMHVSEFVNNFRGKNVKVVFVGEAAFTRIPLLLFRYARSDKKLDREELKKWFGRNMQRESVMLNKIVKQKVEDAGGIYLSKYELYCNEDNKCDLTTKDHEPYLRDSDHVTFAGAMNLGKIIYESNWLNNLFKEYPK